MDEALGDENVQAAVVRLIKSSCHCPFLSNTLFKFLTCYFMLIQFYKISSYVVQDMGNESFGNVPQPLQNVDGGVCAHTELGAELVEYGFLPGVQTDCH